MIKAISWNCRGMGSKNKQDLIRRLVKEEKPQLLLLQETKKKNWDIPQNLDFIWKNSKGVAVNSRGASSGICTIWDPLIFHLES